MKLLTTKNTKIEKSNGKMAQYLGAIMHLSPGNISGYEVCNGRSKGCFNSCLYTAGHGRYNYTKNGRIRKTKMFFENREEFKNLLIKDIEALVRKSERENKKPVVRLNGTSDVKWEEVFPDLFTMFPNVLFYDYTKIQKRFSRFMNKELPKNYYLIFSMHENNTAFAEDALKKGFNVAIVFEKMPKTHKGFKVINGDNHDFRFLEKHTGRVIGLLPKGSAKRDQTGFVVRS